MSTTQTDGPNYDAEIDAAELRQDLAARAAKHAEKATEYRRDGREWEESGGWWGRPPGQLSQYARWELEEMAAADAYGHALAKLQPADRFRNRHRYVEDGQVKVREFMRMLHTNVEETNDRRHGDYQASARHSAYAKVLSLLRNEYGVGWPRLDDLGGTPIPEDRL